MSRIDAILNHPLFRQELAVIQDSERQRIYCGHGLSHLTDVARIAYIDALEQGLTIDRELIYAAALLHDIGRAEQYRSGVPHAKAGEPVAARILADCPFSDAERREILQAVIGHQQEGGGTLAQLIHAADHRSRLCFSCAAWDTCKWSDERKNNTILR